MASTVIILWNFKYHKRGQWVFCVSRKGDRLRMGRNTELAHSPHFTDTKLRHRTVHKAWSKLGAGLETQPRAPDSFTHSLHHPKYLRRTQSRFPQVKHFHDWRMDASLICHAGHRQLCWSWQTLALACSLPGIMQQGSHHLTLSLCLLSQLKNEKNPCYPLLRKL